MTDDDVRIAYQDFGNGAPTVVINTVLGHLEAFWEEEHLHRLFERLAANLRVLMFDHRGNGLSDGFIDPPSLIDRTLDVKAVMDDAGVDRASLFGFDFGSQLAIAFAVHYPERADRMVLANSRVGASAKAQADALHPEAEESPVVGRSSWLDTVGVDVDEAVVYFSPSLAKYPDVLRWLPKFERMVGTRDVYQRQLASVADIDVVGIASQVRAPTLVTHTVGDRLYHVGYARLLAELIPGSKLIEFEGEDHMYWVADNWREMADAQIKFLSDAEVEVPVERQFAAVVFTDIVESTSNSLATGDVEWRRRLDTHDRITRHVAHRHQGELIKSTGDGTLATFTMPSQAVEAVIELRDELAQSGIPIRAGIHAGEIEIREGDISGAVVNLAARVEQAAPNGEIYATKAVTDMLLGSEHAFESAGAHTLKGFEGTWSLHRLGGSDRL